MGTTRYGYYDQGHSTNRRPLFRGLTSLIGKFWCRFSQNQR